MEEFKSEFITIKIEPGIDDESRNDGEHFSTVEPLTNYGENMDSLETLDIEETGNGT